MQVKTAITVNRPIHEVYAYWRDFENLPRFMYHLDSVEETGDRRSHWKASGPAGATVEWDAEIIDDRPDKVISWRSLDGADVKNAGFVHFTDAPGGRGTEVRVEISYDAPGGALGKLFARLAGEDPDQQVRDDLRRFKQVVETGEVLVSDAVPEGTSAGRQLHQRPGQPAEAR